MTQTCGGCGGLEVVETPDQVSTNFCDMIVSILQPRCPRLLGPSGPRNPVETNLGKMMEFHDIAGMINSPFTRHEGFHLYIH